MSAAFLRQSSCTNRLMDRPFITMWPGPYCNAACCEIQEEVGEIESAVARRREASGRIQAGEDEDPRGSVRPAARAVDPDVAAGAQHVRAPRPRQRVGERESPINALGRDDVADAR